MGLRLMQDRPRRIVEDSTKMWSSSFAEVDKVLTILGYCHLDSDREKIFEPLVRRLKQVTGNEMMHGLKASVTLLFLVSMKQKTAINIAFSFKGHFERTLQELRVKPKERHITRFFFSVLKHLLLLIENESILDDVEVMIREDIKRCYQGIDMVESAQAGNVFFAKPIYQPKCSYWIYVPNSYRKKKKSPMKGGNVSGGESLLNPQSAHQHLQSSQSSSFAANDLSYNFNRSVSDVEFAADHRHTTQQPDTSRSNRAAAAAVDNEERRRNVLGEADYDAKGQEKVAAAQRESEDLIVF